MKRITLGRIVHYCLNEKDVEVINESNCGNPIKAGQEFPAVAVAVFASDNQVEQTANLKVLLDGPDDYWVPSAKEVPDYNTVPPTPGYWRWPETA